MASSVGSCTMTTQYAPSKIKTQMSRTVSESLSLKSRRFPVISAVPSGVQRDAQDMQLATQ